MMPTTFKAMCVLLLTTRLNSVQAFQPIATIKHYSLRQPTIRSSSYQQYSSQNTFKLQNYSNFHSLAISKNRYFRCINSNSFCLYSSSSNDENNNNDNNKARVLFLGTPDVAATSLKSIYEYSKQENSPFEVVGVVTQPPKRRKRGGKEIPSPVGLVGEDLGIPILCPEKAKDPDFLDELEFNMKPDLCITAAYGQYLPKRFLAIPKYGTLNIHPSLLPRWRGASPVQRSLEAGDNPVGVSVLFTVSKMDAGPIISQKICPIDDDKDTATNLLPHLFDIGTSCLLDAMPDVIAGKITMENAIVQDEDKVVNANMIDSTEGELYIWKDSARTCHNKVRGFSMWPGTFLYFDIVNDADGTTTSELQKVKVIETRVLDEVVTELTNDVKLGPKKGDGLRVVCGDGSVLELLKVQPVTRNVMDAKSYVNGLRGMSLRWVQPPPTEKEEGAS